MEAQHIRGAAARGRSSRTYSSKEGRRRAKAKWPGEGAQEGRGVGEKKRGVGRGGGEREGGDGGTFGVLELG